MFTSFRRSRRPVAVLAAVALLAGLLAAAPAVGDEHPEADFTATFSACEGVGTSGFEDVPSGHASAGSIDCIAYYGITQGTSATTYSPLASVTREHMALFLVRLAGIVGIEVTSTPDDPGFADTGDLSEKSQTAIAQLADLGITRGTSDTTYSPADSVERGHMALFISRLMDLMDPMADGDTAYGSTPSDVAENEDDEDIGSPFTDLGATTKTAYDAITALWELGVASGISDTSFAPSSSITRAAMADFMAGVLDHSNARPAGVTMQSTASTDFGEVSGVIAISYRTDSFAPMVDVPIKVFTATESGGFNEDTGECVTDDTCDWSDSDTPTDASGNIFIAAAEATVETDDGAGGDGNMENSETWYAWMGSEDNDEFVKGSSGEASVTLTAIPNALGIRVTTDISDKATDNRVDIGDGRIVVITVQLIDATADPDDGMAGDVAKEGVELDIAYSQGGTNLFPAPDPVETDADGQAIVAIIGPEDSDDDSAVTRDDIVTFTGDVDGDDDDETANVTVRFRNVAGTADKAALATDSPYAIIDDDEVSVRATASYHDQFGNAAARGQTLTITFGNSDDDDVEDVVRDLRVRSNGTAVARVSLEAKAGDEITVVATALTGDGSGITAPTTDNVLAVRHAHKNDDGVTAPAADIDAYTDDDRFVVDNDDVAGVLYSYDSGDTFILDDKEVDMDAFEEALDADASVTVVIYSADGVSIFSATSATD
ncbi:MAG: S-layer homology domain-containing protein [Actinomycetia bacterium]|nr:S-layer homology domain-containing protein [Actinomycetes bacterium]